MSDLNAPTVRETPRRAHDVEPGTLAPGTTLANRYRILDLLGKGGMGVVYRARDLSLDTDVALKLLHPSIAGDPQKLAFFRNEVRIARMVTHPNVCRLYDLEEADDGCFITMEHIEGEPLSARLRRGRLPLAQAVRVLRAVGAGLAAAHAAGVVHRDLKPSNVLVANERVVVADFGIAGEGHVLRSGPQDIAGTFGYMAPEQASGAPIDARADVYALGVLACVLTTGARPMPDAAAPTQGAAPRHQTAGAGLLPGAGGSAAALPVADPRPALASLPAPLAALIARCLARAPEDRPSDAGAVVRELDAIELGAPRRKRAVATALVLALAGGGAIAAWQLRASSHAAAPRRIFVGHIDAASLPADERWLGDAVQRMIANELVDAWGADAEVGEPAGAAPDSIALAGTLAGDPSGRLRIELAGETVEAANARALAVAAAARIAERELPAGARHPDAGDLRLAGTDDVEAWRLWRRAQRDSMHSLWGRATVECDQALARDPAFPLARLERALVYDGTDVIAAKELTEARALLDARPWVPPFWRLATMALLVSHGGDVPAGRRLLEGAMHMPLPPRDRHYADVRIAISVFYGADRGASVTLLEALTDRYPDDPSAFKLLAMFYLDSDEPTAPALALRYATRAQELAPDDAGARTDLALALLGVGRRDEARAHAAELAHFDAADKRLARAPLYSLHMALGDPAEAEVDVRRELTGSEGERADGTRGLALLDLYWGRFGIGIQGLLDVADLFDARGVTQSGARARYLAARNAWLLGERDVALAAFDKVAHGHGLEAGLAGVLERIVAGRLDEARARAAKLADGSIARETAELSIASAAGDAAGVLAAYERLEKSSTTIEVLYDVADALERTGRTDEAAATFERLATSPLAWSEPIASTRAWYRLGRLRERAGDRDGARAAFTAITTRWADATVVTPELADARGRLHAEPSSHPR